MRRIFDPNGQVMVFLRRVTDLIVLNLLWVVCSLPIITAGAATSALYYVTLKMVRDEESLVAESFFRSFKENFKQATAMTALFLGGGALLALEIWITMSMGGGQFSALLGVFLVLTVVFLGVVLYTFPLQAWFINPVSATLKNALLLSIRNFPSTVWMLFLNLLPLIIVAFSWNALFWLLPLWLFFIPAGTACLCSLRFSKIFAPIGGEDTHQSA